MKSSLRMGLLIGLAVAAGCVKRQAENLVVFTLSADPPLNHPVTVTLTVADVDHTPAQPLSLGAQPVTVGVYVRETVKDGVAVSAHALVDGCTDQAADRAMSDATGRVANVTLVLSRPATCAGGADGGVDADSSEGGSPDGPSADGSTGVAPTNGASPSDDGDAGDASSVSDAGSAQDGATPPPDAMVALPPMLTNCKSYRQDLTNPGCDVGAKPDDMAISGLAFSPDGKALASTNGFGVTDTWIVAGLALRTNSFSMGGNSANAAAYSPDGTLLAVAGGSGEVDVWRVGAGWVTAFQVFGTQPNIDYKWISFAADNDRVLTVPPLANSLKVWSISRNGTAAEVPTAPVAAVATSPNPPASGPWWVAVASTNNSVSFIDLNAAGAKASTPFAVGVVRSLALSPDARTLAVASNDSLTLWDVSDQEKPFALSPALVSPYFPNDFQTVAFAPSGRYLLATVPRVGGTSLFDVGKRLEIFDVGHPGQPQAVAWSPDGRGVAIGGSCGVIYYCHD